MLGWLLVMLPTLPIHLAWPCFLPCLTQTLPFRNATLHPIAVVGPAQVLLLFPAVDVAAGTCQCGVTLC